MPTAAAPMTYRIARTYSGDQLGALYLTGEDHVLMSHDEILAEARAECERANIPADSIEILELAEDDDHIDWVADDGFAEVKWDRAAHSTARDVAECYVEGGDWPTANEAQWVSVKVWLSYDGIDLTERTEHVVAIEPDVPGCEIDSDDEDLDVSTLGGDEADDLGHVWVSDAELAASGPHGRRGGVGVTYTEVCCRCGLARTTDTHVPFGGRQGYTRKRYEESPDGLSLRDRLDQYVTDHAGAIHTRHFQGAKDVRVYVTRWGWFGVSEADEATWWYLDADQAAKTAQEWAGGGR